MNTGAQRIVIGYDGSGAAQRALEHAADLAGYGSTLAVVSVDQGLEADGAGSLLDEARELLGRRREIGLYVARTGDAADELVETARRLTADLLVVGRRNHGSARGGALGSVSERVVQRAPCDVLVVT
jgi:nucleotide-binding universal stress UspA family protein